MSRLAASRHSGGGARAHLLLPLLNRAAFLDAYFSKQSGGDAHGGLFVPGELDVELGDEVDVELRFQEEQVRFHIRAQVLWKRTCLGRRSLPPGVGIEFLPSERRTERQIVRYAEGKESVNHVERGRRWAMAVDVTVKDEASRATAAGVTEDISGGGCFVSTEEPFEVGAQVEVKLRAARSLFGWIALRGFVAWRRVEAGRSGIGVEFAFDSDRQRARVKRMVELHKERSLRQVHIKVPRAPSTPPTSSAE